MTNACFLEKLGERPLSAFQSHCRGLISVHEFIGVAQKVTKGNLFPAVYFKIIPSSSSIFFFKGNYVPFDGNYSRPFRVAGSINLEEFLCVMRHSFPGEGTLRLKLGFNGTYLWLTNVA